MTQASFNEFDLYQFEDRIEELLAALQRLRSENQALRTERSEQLHCNETLKLRLEQIIERLRRFEATHAQGSTEATLS